MEKAASNGDKEAREFLGYTEKNSKVSGRALAKIIPLNIKNKNIKVSYNEAAEVIHLSNVRK